MPRRKIFKLDYDSNDFDPPAPTLTVYFSPHRTVILRAYLAKVRIPLIFEDTIRVIGTNDKVALIGRDILNKLSLELDGTHHLLKIIV